MLLTPEQIKQAIDELHQKKPGKILHTAEIYEAIVKAQYNEDMKEAMMEIEEKIRILKSLDTKSLIQKLHQYETEFQKAMIDEAMFKSQNHDYLGSGDCQAVKKILAELAAQAPSTKEDDKKTTVADREAWLQKQREENKELSAAIVKQREVAFLIDDHGIKVEMARRRLTSATAVLALKTQQLAFLASG